jgi:DNA adenine methylase
MHASSSGAGRCPAAQGSSLRPLLKWAGGKRQLLPAIGAHYPADFGRYIEPFFGSGAVFFDVAGRGLANGRDVVLADVNPDLIGCYRALRDRTDEVIGQLEALAEEHRRRGDACYYEVRDERFNPARAALSRAAAHGAPPEDRTIARVYTPAVAAMLIFLNRTGFNGLFRLNKQGNFNVPVGRYANPRICDPDLLHEVARTFRRSKASLRCVPFDVAIDQAGHGDFVYCDPPYAPLSVTASFAHYTAGGFSAFDQARLQRGVIAACNRGAHVVLSNSSAPEIVALYTSPDARAAGLDLRLVPARRAINSRPGSRGPVNEVIVSNVASSRVSRLDALKPKALKATTRASISRRRTA